MIEPSEEIMRKALILAKKNVEDGGFPIAAIIVKDNEIFAEAVDTIYQEKNPTGHAEINAIKIASKKLNSKRLEGCYLYCTFEPCPMCASAAVWARMKGIIYGASFADATSSCPQRVNISCKEVIERSEFGLEVYPEFMRKECKKLIEEFSLEN